ncbi:MAG: ribose-5-phosphate isomerase RpiA [Rhodothermales bacterium]|nr:ribose-5-phosphate isomerase RpiA [Rhodothermales bacterium]MCA0268738.1 ribose-5-phosphate isomerase RpiA [Bacteroidota bacterium]
MSDDLKAAVGRAAAALVEDGMTLGLGTGSTTAFALQEIGRRIRENGLRVRGVPTSFAAERLARQHGIPLTSFEETPSLDLALDGADEVSPSLDLVKGRGAAMTREKIVAAQAARFVVLVDASKRVPRLGTKMPVPVEVLPMAVTPVAAILEALGATVAVREGSGKDGPVVTDQGLWILDASFDGGLTDPAITAAAIKIVPGVLDHGLFVGMATDVLVASPEGIEHLTR